MTLAAKQAVSSLALPNIPICSRVSARAAANIALVKYWGKRDSALNLPVTSSLSLSLGSTDGEYLGTDTTLSVLADDSEEDMIVLNGEALLPDSNFYKNAVTFVNLFRGSLRWRLCIETNNSVPTAAGVASSASGFAALTLALSQLLGWSLSLTELSKLARLGSGSACRSLFSGFVEWERGVENDGSDSAARPLNAVWPGLCWGLVEIDIKEKSVSSRDGMARVVAESPLYKEWPNIVERDLALVKRAISEQDFKILGQTAESNSLAMHRTTQGCVEPFSYLTEESHQLIGRVHAARRDAIEVYVTFDAGPNGKLLFESKDLEAIRTYFPEMKVVKTSP